MTGPTTQGPEYSFEGLSDLELVEMQSAMRRVGEDRDFLNAILVELGKRHRQQHAPPTPSEGQQPPRTGQYNINIELDPTDTDRLQAQLTRTIQAIGQQISAQTNDGRNYRALLYIRTNITVAPDQAEIGEFAHWEPFLETTPLSKVATVPGAEDFVFRKTIEGWKRVE